MPSAPGAVPPLPPADIQRLLQGIYTDAAAPTELAIEAFTVTAASLYQWCVPADIDAAINRVTPPMPGFTTAFSIG